MKRILSSLLIVFAMSFWYVVYNYQTDKGLGSGRACVKLSTPHMDIIETEQYLLGTLPTKVERLYLTNFFKINEATYKSCMDR